MWSAWVEYKWTFHSSSFANNSLVGHGADVRHRLLVDKRTEAETEILRDVLHLVSCSPTSNITSQRQTTSQLIIKNAYTLRK